MQEQLLSSATRGLLQCVASSRPPRAASRLFNRRQQHNSMTRGSRLQRAARLKPSKATQKQGGPNSSGSNNSSSSSGTGKRMQQPRSSSSSPTQQAEVSPQSWWLQRLPGDSGWDLLRMRERDTKTFNRIREAEVIHARWAMLGVISLLLSDVSGSFPPKELTAAALAPWGVVVLLCLGLIESYRLAALWDEDDFEKRAYPGKRFDILGFTRPKQAPATPPGEPEQLPGFGVFAPWLGGLTGWLAGGWWFAQRDMTQLELLEMKSRELRNGRLAMVSFVGCCMATALTGKGPITLLVEHLADPMHSTILQTLQ